MITNQYYQIIRQVLNGRQYSEALFETSSAGTLTVLSGNTGSYTYVSFPTMTKQLLHFPESAQYATMVSKSFIMFGSGTTAPTAADYKLESMIGSGLTINAEHSTQSDSKRFTVTVTNNSGAQVSISELGVFVPVSQYAGYFNCPNEMAMVLRETFAPVVLAGGDSAVFNLVIGAEIAAAS